MPKKRTPLTRRDFLKGTLGTTIGASVIGPGFIKAGGIASGSSLVTIVRDQNAMDASNNVNVGALKSMLGQTLTKLTGITSPKDAWLSLVTPDDTIGLVPTPHLNPHPFRSGGSSQEFVDCRGNPRRKDCRGAGRTR